MDIYKISSADTLSNRLDKLNDMIIALNGKLAKANFNTHHLQFVFDAIAWSAMVRGYARDVALGSTVATYTGWSHIKAESGYSIWKYTPPYYYYGAENEIYKDDMLLVNKGLATSETATTFSKVWVYSGSAYTDVTTEAGTEGGTAFDLLSETDDYIYLGSATTFAGVKFEFGMRGSNNTLKLEYYNGAAWVALTALNDNLVDNTSNLESDGAITWDSPTSWAAVSINGTSAYYIRISTTTAPITVATANYIIPSGSVISLLALSSTQVINEEWGFCSYNGSIYVTIRNTGVTAYEGDFYITSSSSATNLQNFFIYNNPFTGNYKNSNW